MKLHKILSAVGFLLWITGVAMMDSEQASIPVAMIAAGLAITILTAYDDGTIGRKGGEEE